MNIMTADAGHTGNHGRLPRLRQSAPFPLLRTYLSRAYRQSRFILLNYSLSLAGLAVTVGGGSVQDILPTAVGAALTVAGILGAVIAWHRARSVTFMCAS